MDNQVRTGDNGLPEITLSDGRVASFTRKPKVRDSELAAEQGGRKDNPTRKTAAFIARLIVIEGQAVRVEQVLDLELEDFVLLADNIPGNF